MRQGRKGMTGSGQRGGMLLFWLFLAGLLSGCAATAPVVRQPPEIGAELRCPVCGVHPAEQPRWQCQIFMGDGRQIAFDGGKDMFSYLRLLAHYNYAKGQGVGKGLAEVWVRDYSSGVWLDARAAWYVVGSEVRSPAGQEPIPFPERSGAEGFRRIHGGKVVDFAGVDGEVLKEPSE